jgi:EAL domain-containing protein (putative c-di-GMP-specific phosphodiesterase class I)
MRQSIDRVNAVTEVLRGCVAEGEIFLMYQPVYNLNDSSVTGFEALARIRNKKLGLLSPGEFIPLAETDRTIIGSLTGFTVKTALRFLRRAMDEKEYKGFVSVNVSAKQLEDPGFVGLVLSAINETGAPAEKLQLEIDELALSEDLILYEKKFEELRKQGVSITLDDFGGAKSSFYHLSRLPLSILKVDQAFFKANDKRAVQLNKTVLEIAKRYNLDAIAERVETDEDYEMLRTVGFDTAQGFHFSLPLMEDAAIGLL